MRVAHKVIDRLWPPMPESVRDIFAQTQCQRLTRQMPMLHLALMLIIVATLLSAGTNASRLIHYGLPSIVLVACFLRLVTWAQHSDTLPEPASAHCKLRSVTLVSGLVAVIASIWCVASWATAPSDEAMYFPMLMVLGEIATVIIMMPVRQAAYVNLVIGTGPITIALALFGEDMDRVLALAIAATGTFFVGLLRHQHAAEVDRLRLAQRMTELSETDLLTGLYNRRGMEGQFAALRAQAPELGLALILIDLDRFKPINDLHGHEAGDAVLVEVASRIGRAVRGDGKVCRLGGDEFAVLLRPDAARPPKTVAGAILAELRRPIVYAGTPLSIGASLGMSRAGAHEVSLPVLLSIADAAMYRAKRGKLAAAA
jgi:diguanylate cyclase